MAIDRHDQREIFEEGEANAIGTEYLRADLLPPKAAAATKDLLIPVSYTHLRAHETVLDLVCRLLLEKKFF